MPKDGQFLKMGRRSVGLSAICRSRLEKCVKQDEFFKDHYVFVFVLGSPGVDWMNFDYHSYAICVAPGVNIPHVDLVLTKSRVSVHQAMTNSFLQCLETIMSPANSHSSYGSQLQASSTCRQSLKCFLAHVTRSLTSIFLSEPERINTLQLSFRHHDPSRSCSEMGARYLTIVTRVDLL